MSHPPFAGAWLRQWRAASVALADQRERELRTLSDEDARAATLALLDLGAGQPRDLARETMSGLVDQQAVLHRRRPPA